MELCCQRLSTPIAASKIEIPAISKAVFMTAEVSPDGIETSTIRLKRSG